MFGRLEKVSIRDYWKTEDRDFTPWLASEENIQLLSETLNINLEVEETEKFVGNFKADILCKNTDTEDWVVIENQFEQTDHKHLGQIITYGAGLKSGTLIWIAEKIREEHQAAINFLNQNTNENINIFGVEIELWKIGNSLVAPKFNIKVAPNNWEKRAYKAVKEFESRQMSESEKLRLKFWSEMVQKSSDSKLNFSQSPSGRYYYSVRIGKSGYVLSQAISMSNKQVFVQLYVRGENTDFSSIEKIYEDKDTIQNSLGKNIEWIGFEGEGVKRLISEKRKFDINDTKQWHETQLWLINETERLYNTIKSYIM